MLIEGLAFAAALVCAGAIGVFGALFAIRVDTAGWLQFWADENEKRQHRNWAVGFTAVGTIVVASAAFYAARGPYDSIPVGIFKGLASGMTAVAILLFPVADGTQPDEKKTKRSGQQGAGRNSPVAPYALDDSARQSVRLITRLLARNNETVEASAVRSVHAVLEQLPDLDDEQRTQLTRSIVQRCVGRVPDGDLKELRRQCGALLALARGEVLDGWDSPDPVAELGAILTSLVITHRVSGLLNSEDVAALTAALR